MDNAIRSLVFFCVLVLEGCGGSSSGDSGGGNETETISGVTKPISFGSGSATILEGTWILDCTVITGVPSKAVVIFTGNGRSANAQSYNSFDCDPATKITLSTSQSNIVVGNATTSESGLAAFNIDLTPVGDPTYYTIFRLDGNKLYTGKFNVPFTAPDPEPGSTPSNRVNALDFSFFYTRL